MRERLKIFSWLQTCLNNVKWIQKENNPQLTEINGNGEHEWNARTVHKSVWHSWMAQKAYKSFDLTAVKVRKEFSFSIENGIFRLLILKFHSSTAYFEYFQWRLIAHSSKFGWVRHFKLFLSKQMQISDIILVIIVQNIAHFMCTHLHFYEVSKNNTVQGTLITQQKEKKLEKTK